LPTENDLLARALEKLAGARPGTPAPWEYDGDNTIYAAKHTVCIADIPDHPADGEFAPEQIAERSAWYKESAANAKLIESAPEIRDLLEAILADAAEHDWIQHPRVRKALEVFVK
jgi:hypothetical protein